MYLAFVDCFGCEGRITGDGTVEYYGPFEGTIETLSESLDWDGDVSIGDLQDLSIDLFAECDLVEIETVEDR